MKALAWLAAAYCAATLLHFAHNAEYLADYPGMPTGLTRGGVWLAWAGVTSIGAAGCLLLRGGYARAGLGVLALYASLGLDSLAHYGVAPWSAHTVAMNFTIALEAATAGLLLLAIARRWQ